MDLQIFRLINDLALKSDILDLVGVFFARYLIWLLFFIVIVLGFLPPNKKGETISKANAIKAILAGLISWGIALVVGYFFFRARPFVSYDVNLLIDLPITSKSFPSEHAAVSFAFGCTLFLFSKKIGICFLIAALLIGLSRIYVGVHYPLDVIIGAIIGCLSALIIKSSLLLKAKNKP